MQTHPALREALAGKFQVAHHGVLVSQMLAHVDFLEESISALDGQIDATVEQFDAVPTRLQTIPGVARKTAICLLAEIGADMSVFATAAHLASRAGICPGNNASGGKRKSGRTRHGSVWLKTALTEAAQAAARTKGTYLAAHHASIRGRRGTFKAIGATRHDLLIAYWHIVHDRVDYHELGADWAMRRHSREHQTRRLVRQLEALGLQVQLTDAAGQHTQSQPRGRDSHFSVALLRPGSLGYEREAFALMHAEKSNFSIVRMARLLEVSRAGYYAWLATTHSDAQLAADRTAHGYSIAFLVAAAIAAVLGLGVLAARTPAPRQISPRQQAPESTPR